MKHEERINIALGIMLRYFNFLDLNVGLCIRFLENPEHPEKSNAKLFKMSASDKLDRLQVLIKEHKATSDPLVQSDFDKCFEAARQARAMRNFFIHGIWDYLPQNSEEPVGFYLPPWANNPLGDEAKQRMTLGELEGHANTMKTVFEDFMALRCRYRI